MPFDINKESKIEYHLSYSFYEIIIIYKSILCYNNLSFVYYK